MSTILTKSEIEELLKLKPLLIEGYVNIEEQLQPNGFDLMAREVAQFCSSGQITTDNSLRLVFETAPLPFDRQDFTNLMPSRYPEAR